MNKVAIVSGGSRGIGASIVETLASSGFDVVLNYRFSANKANDIASKFSNVVTFQADVSDHAQVKSLVDFTISKFGRIDLLVNNAGIDFINTLSDTSDSDFDTVLRNNLYSAFYLSKEVSPYMINAKSGLIINISSIWGIVGASCEMAYSVSKAGLDAMTKSLAKELGPSNIRVNSIAPGIIDTDMNSFLSKEELSEIVNDIPLERIGLPSDVADTVLFLDKNSYITGQVIQVTGGWNLQ
ncbi:3-oxoacyl-[acyl-carrier-protein] reductase [Clostridium sp. CAG:793]|nr:3-oxoacyl-[acyl-carrier-protein] reductase [Clostridium sp. CAG:793]